MEFLQNLFANQWLTLLLAVAAFVVWLLGNVLKRKILVCIGIVLCVAGFLSLTKVFGLLA